MDAREPAGPARFWRRVPDREVVFEAPDEVVIGKGPDTWPGMVFLQVPGDKTGKNRLHLDLSPDDQRTEVARMIALGTRRVGIGRGEDVSWTVPADLEGNEFCVLSPKTSLSA